MPEESIIIKTVAFLFKKYMRYLAAVVLIAVLLTGIYFYTEFTRKPADLNKSDAVEFVKASDLSAFYINYEDSANKKYSGKVIEVSGSVIEVENQQDTLLSVFLGDTLQTARVSCLMDKNSISAAKKVVRGDLIKIKGICTGYLMDVELNRCVLVKQ
jgi:regulatory protein YycI of two-component signal transduction system YycFG